MKDVINLKIGDVLALFDKMYEWEGVDDYCGELLMYILKTKTIYSLTPAQLESFNKLSGPYGKIFYLQWREANEKTYKGWCNRFKRKHTTSR
jgi:hypothetical protein